MATSKSIGRTVQDPYKTLKIHKKASPDEVKAAYRALARKYHPDVNQSDEAKQLFQQISEAYALLSDPSRRRMYDLFGNADPSVTPIETQIVDVVEKAKDRVKDFFGFGDNGPRRGVDTHQVLNISFSDIWSGSTRTVDVTQAGEKRSLQIKIPKGATDKSILRLKGQGQSGEEGGANGDLYLTLKLQPSKIFRRDKDDLYIKTAIPLKIAQDGGDIEVKLPDDSRLKVRVPIETSGGTALRIKHSGFVGADDTRGHLYVIVHIRL